VWLRYRRIVHVKSDTLGYREGSVVRFRRFGEMGSILRAGRSMSVFQGRHFEGEVILWAVRWYCRYGISYRVKLRFCLALVLDDLVPGCE
jgi:hypothetical protein